MSFFTNVFVMIEQADKYCFVHVYQLSNGATKKKEKRKFFFEKHTKTPSVMIDYIYSFSKKYSHTYISTILDSSLQQIMIEEDMNRKSLKAINDEHVSILVHDNWRIHCNTQEISAIKKDFESLAIDFIFSPFALLYFLYQKHNRGENSLYILVMSSVITIILFKNSIAVAYKNTSLLSSMNNQDIGDIGEIDELDELEDEFDMQLDVNDSHLNLDLDLSIGDEEDDQQEQTPSNKNIQEPIGELKSEIINDIQTTIKNFYDSKYYKNDDDIINAITIFSDGIIDAKLKNQIRDETMFDIFSKDIKFADVVCDVIKKTLEK